MTTDNHTPDPTPALLSTAEIDNMRERAQAFSDGENEEQIGDVANDRRALLAHLDAITPRAAVDGEALGLQLRASLRGLLPAWLSEEQKAIIRDAALALHATGYAARASEGEAERAEQSATIARLTAELADLRTLYDAQVQETKRLAAAVERAEDERDTAQAELAEANVRAVNFGVAVVESTERAYQAKIDTLTAELAEALDTLKMASVEIPSIVDDRDAEIARLEKAEAVARLDGAREEREAMVGLVKAARARHAEREEPMGTRYPIFSIERLRSIFAEIEHGIRARATEGRQGS